MLIGKKVRLQPNKSQTQDFFRFAGTSRFSWNESLAFYESVYKDKGEYATLSDMMKHLQDLKHNNPDYAWLNEVPEAITKQTMKDLLKAYKKFYKDRKTGSFDPKHPDKYKPKFKKKGKCIESFYQRTDNIHKTDDTHIKITGIKKPVKCSMLKDVELPKNVQNPRITFDGKYWYLSYSYEIDETDIVDHDRDTLGIDLGIKDFAVLSNGQHFANINKQPEIRRLRKRLKRLQRQISRKYEANASIDKNGKKIFRKTNNIKKLEQQIRMIYRRILMYKCEQNGTELIIADRWYPSSKTCSCCGNIKHNLKLSDRTYKCDVCGFIMDRDENAAVNLERYPKIVPKSKPA